MKILSFGELLLRLSAPGYTKLFQRDCLETSFCGGEANVAASLSVLGLDSAFLSKLPDTSVGIAGVNYLQYFGVDTSKILYGTGRMGLYYLEKGVSQRPSKVIYDRKHSAIAQAVPEEFNWEELLDDVNWFHWTGINPALSDNMIQICKEACAVARKKGLVISCDLNYRSKLWSSEKACQVMSELLRFVDVCIANEEDAEKVLGIKAADSDVRAGVLKLKGYETVAKTISSRYGCKYVAITLRQSYSASVNGWSALLYCAEDDALYSSSKYNINLVDRVGGGDSFTAALIYGIVSGFENSQIIEFATAASCLKQTMEGDINRATVDDIMGLLEGNANGRVQR